MAEVKTWQEKVDFLHANKDKLPGILKCEDAIDYYKRYKSQFCGIFAKEVGQSWTAVRKYMTSKGYFRKSVPRKKEENGLKRYSRKAELVTELWVKPAGEHYKHVTFEVMDSSNGRTSLIRLLLSREIVSKLVKSV